MSGPTTITGKIPNLKLGSQELSEINVSISCSKFRIGNDFFKDLVLYIDNSNNALKIKKK